MKRLFVLIAIGIALSGYGNAQQKNCTLSNFGASFIFNATPTEKGCVQIETGGIFNKDVQTLNKLVTFGVGNKTDISATANLLNRISYDNKTVTQFGGQVEIIARHQFLQKGSVAMSIAPRGTIFTNTKVGRVGSSLAVQFVKGRHAVGVNSNFTRGVGNESVTPRYDYQTATDYSYSVGKRVSGFGGMLQDKARGSKNTLAYETGVGFQPRDNVLIEAAYQRFGYRLGQKINQFQARITINWGKLWSK